MIVTIANRKGGVGKTTPRFNLGFTYALQKREVLFIDLDSQANLSLLCKAAPLDLEAWKAGTVQPVGKGVSILPATKRFAALENEIDQRFDRNTFLREELLPKLPAADIIIIDTAPALGVLNINALCRLGLRAYRGQRGFVLHGGAARDERDHREGARRSTRS